MVMKFLPTTASEKVSCRFPAQRIYRRCFDRRFCWVFATHFRAGVVPRRTRGQVIGDVIIHTQRAAHIYVCSANRCSEL